MFDRIGIIGVALAFTAAATANLAPVRAATPAAAVSANAPVDQYFGRFKQSALRIRQRIDQLGARYRQRTESDADLIHDAGDVQSSMDAWLAAYPHDSWGPPTAFHLAELYAEIQTAQARTLALRAFKTVATRFPATSYGHLARLRLAQGLPPLKPESAIVASPSPVPITTVPPSPSAAAPSVTAPAASAPATAPAPALSAPPATVTPPAAPMPMPSATAS